MVKQDTVQQAMEEMNRPCTSREILEYMLEKKMIEPKEWDMKMVISRALAALKKWEIVDRILQGHNSNRGYLWYLTKNGAPEHDSKTCQECIHRRKTFNHYISLARLSSQQRSVRITNSAFYHDSNWMGKNHMYERK